MALTAKSLFVYKLQVTTLNQNLDFKISALGPTLTAVVALGFYSPNGLAQAIAFALQTQDSTNIYNVTVNRNILGGTQNRITIATNGTFLQLLFGTGPNVNTSISTLAGFNQVNYTGATSYTGSQTTGSSLIPTYIGYSYLDNQNLSKVFGAVNISASGLKEAVTFNIQQFIEVTFKYEAKTRMPLWVDFFTWAQAQKPFDFTPEITSPDTFFECTLEKTDYDTKGLGWRMPEMLPQYPNNYQTGALVFRITPSSAQFTVGG